MNVKVENVETNVVKLEIEVEAEKFEQGMQKSYIKNVKRINVPGFRKGKAPRKMIEKMYGEGIFYEDAINYVIPEAYDTAIAEQNLTPVDQPEIDVVQIGEGQPFIFSAKVTLKPEVVLGDYKGVEIEKVSYEVSDEQVEAELARMQEQNARMVTVEDRAVENGDIADINFEGFVDGVAFEGGKGENFKLEIGSGTFIPGFEEQLIGKAIGEETDVNVTFPEDYHAEELKAKAAVFKVKINGIQYKELPELDDDFAKDTTEFDTLEEVKADILGKLTKDAENRTKAETENKVLEKVVANSTIELPQCMIDQQVDRLVNDFEYRVRNQGLTLEQYFQYSGTDMESLREQMKASAEPQVRTNLVLEKIAEVEAVAVTEEDIEAEYNKTAEQYNMEVEKIKEIMKANEAALTQELKMEKTIQLLVDAAVQK